MHIGSSIAMGGHKSLQLPQDQALPFTPTPLQTQTPKDEGSEQGAAFEF